MSVATVQPDDLNLAGVDASKLGRLDPYLVWALRTQFAGYANGWQKQHAIPILLRLNTQGDPPTARARVDALMKAVSGFVVPGVFQPFDKTNAFAGFFVGSILTALVPVAQLTPFILALEDGEGFKLGLPRTDSVAVQPVEWQAGVVPRGKSWIAIIDHGVGFAHEAFLETDRSGTRIDFFWDQDPRRPTGSPTGADKASKGPWKDVPGLGYGGQITKWSIDKLRREALSKGLNETSIYEDARYAPARRPRSHGTHVLDIAAGNPNPFSSVAGAGPAAAGDEEASAAERARLVVVQLPQKPYSDTSGASLCVHVMDALRYIRSVVSRDARVIVNLSDGAYAGPHNGASLLERGIDEFLSQNDNSPEFTLVVAAGNGAERRGYATGTVEKGQPAELIVQLLPDNPMDTAIEVWIDSTDKAGHSATELALTTQLTVVGPDGSTLTLAGHPAAAQCLSDTQGRPVAMLNATTQSPDCPDRLGFVFIACPTRRRQRAEGAGEAPHGLWAIRMASTSPSSIVFHARIQRANPSLGDTAPRREAVFMRCTANDRYVSPQGTLNNVATGAKPVVVGGALLRGNFFPEPGNPSSATPRARYSSRGASTDPHSGKDRVGYLATSEESTTLHGLLAAGSRSGTRFRMNGTSVAAPRVTRLLADGQIGSGKVPVDGNGMQKDGDGVPAVDRDR